MPVNLPSSANLGELYAFCAEYSASHILWSDHQKILDGYIQNRLKSLTMLEKKKDLNQEDSVIEPNKSPHDFASVIGKIILTRYPKLWPKILTGRPSLIGQFGPGGGLGINTGMQGSGGNGGIPGPQRGKQIGGMGRPSLWTKLAVTSTISVSFSAINNHLLLLTLLE